METRTLQQLVDSPPGTRIIVVCDVHRRKPTQYRIMNDDPALQIAEAHFTPGNESITLTNGTQINLVPPRANALRGYSANIIAIDNEIPWEKAAPLIDDSWLIVGFGSVGEVVLVDLSA